MRQNRAWTFALAVAASLAIGCKKSEAPAQSNTQMEDYVRDLERKKQRQMDEIRFSTGGDAPAPQTVIRGDKVGRNDPCPCGSGKKYKKCCGAKG